MTPLLTTERLILRRWRPEDRSPFAAMNADPRVMQYFPRLLSREESDGLIDRIEAHFEQHGFGLFALQPRDAAELNVPPRDAAELIVPRRDAAQFIGYVGLAVPAFEAPFTPCVEIGWRLAAPHWGQGFATEAARAVLAFGFGVIGLREIVSFTVPANIASRRVMEKIGMTRDEHADFDHPRIPPGHPLRKHVLYRALAARESDRA